MTIDGELVASRLIGEIRRKQGLTQAELARRAGLPRSVVNAYERGHRQPRVDAMARMASAGGLELKVGEPPGVTDPARAGRILEQVLDLAEQLPYRRPGRLAYPSLMALAA